MKPMIEGLDDDADGPVTLHAQATGSTAGVVCSHIYREHVRAGTIGRNRERDRQHTIKCLYGRVKRLYFSRCGRCAQGVLHRLCLSKRPSTATEETQVECKHDTPYAAP